MAGEIQIMIPNMVNSIGYTTTFNQLYFDF